MIQLLYIDSVAVLGMLLIPAGLALRYIVARNRFIRRGPGGLQHFSSYSKALAFTALEKLARFIGLLLILAGILLLLVTWFNNDRSKKAQAEQERRSHSSQKR